MNTSRLLRLAAGPSLGLLFAAMFTSSVQAGPGPQYWRAFGQPKVESPTAPAPAAAPTQVCVGSEIVPVTTMKPAQANGRGALVAVQTGTKRVCHTCPVTTVTTTNDWPSHRGPAVTTTSTKVGGEHNCTAACALQPKV